MAIVRITAELFGFLIHQRAWWMIPVVVGILFVAVFVAFATYAPLGPFIYSLI